MDSRSELNSIIGDAAIPSITTLKVGSDVEVSNRVAHDLRRNYDDVIYSEGSFWSYSGTHWTKISDNEIRKLIHRYDGAKHSNTSTYKLTKTKIDSIYHELCVILENPAFFETNSIGINCLSGFIVFDESGTPKIIKHRPDQKCRYVIDAEWNPSNTTNIPDGSLLKMLLSGCFKGDDDAKEKTGLIGEALGSACLGIATQIKAPKAIILLGRTAENGKSQVLEMFRSLLPASAVSSIPPGKFDNDRYIIQLVGKNLNTSDELSSAAAISSDIFKQTVTGDRISAREIYKSACDFKPLAQQIYATNELPSFKSGMDKGVRRRLLVITFNRPIPLDERIESLGARIGDQEMDLLLNFAVNGASRIIRQGSFTEPTSSIEALSEWLLYADPVLAWVEECISPCPAENVSSGNTYKEFVMWAEDNGYQKQRLPGVSTFVQRLKAACPYIMPCRTGKERRLTGFKIKQ